MNTSILHWLKSPKHLQPYVEIYLEYEGTSFEEWDVPLLCTIDDKSAPKTILHCPVPGTHRIKPIVKTPPPRRQSTPPTIPTASVPRPPSIVERELHQTPVDIDAPVSTSGQSSTRKSVDPQDDGVENLIHSSPHIENLTSAEDVERFLSISADVNCFRWYISQSSSLTLENPNQFIKVWIFDPENADMSEKNLTATSPPVISRSLSKQFWNLGQTPVITTFFGRRQYSERAFQDGMWIFEIPSLTNDNIARVYGRAVTFQDCFVFDTPFVFAQPIYILGYEKHTAITVPAGSDAIIAWAACYPTTAVLVTDVGTFHTNDGFLTTEEIKFPPRIMDLALIHSVKAVAIIFPDIFILIMDILYKVTEEQIFRVGQSYDALNKNVIGIRAKTWCAAEYPLLDRTLSEVIIWTEDEVFLSYQNDDYHTLIDTMLLKEELRLRRTPSLLIINACYDSLTTTIAVLLECTGCMADETLYLAAFNEGTSEWTLRDFSLSSSTNGAVHMEVIPSATTSMVLWNDDKIFYTYKQNKMYGFLQVSGTNRMFSAFDEGSTIHQIIIDYSGNTIIKLKNNVLFFLKFEMIDAVKLVAWESASTKFVFYYNPAGDVYLLTIDGRNIKRQIYPLKLEIFSATLGLQEVCPYISFKHSLDLNIYYLDMGEKLTFWAQIVFLENLGLSIETEVHSPDLLAKKTHQYYEIARGICTKNQTITFYQENNYSEITDYESAVTISQGVLTVQLEPSSLGKTCESKSKLSHIRVGCTPEKELRVIRKPSQCEQFNFTIPRKYLKNQDDKNDLEVQYALGTYGCPIEAYYAEPFRPTVALYISNKFWSIAETNYILWEMNGRTDFNYNTTMEQVQCLYRAQNWHSMAKEHNQSSILTPEKADEIWGPHNYKSCFLTSQKGLRDLDDPYEILNHSGINSITWPQYHTGVYMFRLKIVDPNFSFCNMTAFFAVHTYGIIERPNWLLVAGWSMMIVTLFLGVLVISYFRYVKIFRTLAFVDPLLSFRSDVRPAESVDEPKKD
ncbi:cation channel sperm-associated auxiliary subunit epsilon-like [Elgaria multicarinata webbii]|uniref:cation channel sperm-associated auxiliary subunit epsilon-like n=1 Tax=Elgaria multicarinata webbii TaxID=159646 RepID=UPI002FCD1103